MRAHMPYLQLWKGNWRVRKPVPKSVQALIGRGRYLTRGLGTADRAEADRLAIPILAEFQDIIGRAEQGDWPPLDPEEWGDFLAHEWRGWAKRNDPEHVRQARAIQSLRTKTNSERQSPNTLRNIGAPSNPEQRASKR